MLSIDMVGSLFRGAGPLKWVVPRDSEDEIDAQDSFVGAAAFLEAMPIGLANRFLSEPAGGGAFSPCFVGDRLLLASSLGEVPLRRLSP